MSVVYTFLQSYLITISPALNLWNIFSEMTADGLQDNTEMA